jgi:hypothetical protein
MGGAEKLFRIPVLALQVVTLSLSKGDWYYNSSFDKLRMTIHGGR